MNLASQARGLRGKRAPRARSWEGPPTRLAASGECRDANGKLDVRESIVAEDSFRRTGA